MGRYMKKLLTFITSSLVAGAVFYILQLIFNNLSSVVINTFLSAPTPTYVYYGHSASFIGAIILSAYSWEELYRYMNKPQLI